MNSVSPGTGVNRPDFQSSFACSIRYPRGRGCVEAALSRLSIHYIPLALRGHQLFPVLDPSQIDMAKRFASGPAHDFAPGEIVYDVGERNVPAWLVLKGSIDVVRRDGLNHESAITSLGPGQFSGEVSQLAGAATLASARAGPEGCAALPFDARPRARPDDRLCRGGRDHDASVHPSPRWAH
jgi:CRP-like cAMP-binding protein